MPSIPLTKTAKLLRSESCERRCPLCPIKWWWPFPPLTQGIRETYVGRVHGQLHLWVKWTCKKCKKEFLFSQKYSDLLKNRKKPE